MKARRTTLTLAAAFGVLMVILVTVGYWGVDHLAEMNHKVQVIVGRRWQMVRLSRAALRYSALNGRLTMQIFLMEDRNEIQPLLELRVKNTETISELLRKIEAGMESETEKALMAKIWSSRIPYVTSYERALNLLLQEGKPEAGRAMMSGVVLTNLIAYHQAWEVYVDYQSKRMEEAGDAAEARYAKARQELIALVAAATLLSAAIALFVVRSLSREITERRLAEENFQRSQTSLRMAGRLSRMGAWAVEQPGSRVIWSDEVCAIHEVPPGFTPTIEAALHFYDPGFREAITAAFAACGRDGTPFDLELPVITARGQRLWVRVIGEAERDAGGIIRRVQGALQDTTARKEAEAEVRRSQKRLHDIFNGLGPGMFVGLLTPGGILIEVNQAPLAAAGLNSDDVLGKPFDETHWWSHSPDARQQLREAIARAARGEASRYDVQMRGAGNEVIDIDFSLQPLRDETGEVAFLIPSANVIAERKRAETALRESEERTRLLIKASNIGLWDWNLVTNEVFFSAEWKSQLGYADAELPSRLEEWESRLHPEDREPTLTAVKDYVEGRRADYEVEFRLRHKDGSWRCFLTRGNQTRDATGKTVRIMGCHIDVTERKRAQTELEAEKARVVAAQAIAKVGSWETDLTTLVVIWSEETYRIFDADPKTFQPTHQGFMQRVHPDDRAAVDHAFTQSLNQHSGCAIEHRVFAPDGPITFVEERWQVFFDGQGKPVRALGTCQDITERKRSEAQLEKAHKELVEASRRAGMVEVATGILHNVGNVLNSVNVASTHAADSLRKSKVANLAKVAALLREHEKDLGVFFTDDPKGRRVLPYLAQLAEELAGEQAGALKELGELQKNIEHIKEVVTAQQRGAKGAGKSETLQVAELVEDTLRMDSGGSAHRDIHVITEFEPVAALTVEKHKVLQILLNLVRNAKQSCHDAGTLEKRLTVRATGGERCVRIAISDNGVGISPENLGRIFAYGFTTRKDGHGFGLHSAAAAAAEMGGSLSARSDGPGQGATFTLELPFKQQPMS